MIVPDGIEPVEVMRAWRISRSFKLVSLNYVQWNPGKPAIASCLGEYVRVAQQHHSPDERCTCGIYGATDYAQLPVGPGFIYGKAKMWGKVVPGQRGVRAEYAYPSEFHVPRSNHFPDRAVLQEYGVPVVEHASYETWPLGRPSWLFSGERNYFSWINP